MHFAQEPSLPSHLKSSKKRCWLMSLQEYKCVYVYIIKNIHIYVCSDLVIRKANSIEKVNPVLSMTLIGTILDS